MTALELHESPPSPSSEAQEGPLSLRFRFIALEFRVEGGGGVWVWVCKVLDPAPFGATRANAAWCPSRPMRPLGPPGPPTQWHVKWHLGQRTAVSFHSSCHGGGGGTAGDRWVCPRKPGTPGTEASVHHWFWHQAPPETLMGGPYLKGGGGFQWAT